MERYEQILELLEGAWRLERSFLTEIPAEERERPGSFERWSRKDVVAHIGAYDQRMADRICRALRGDPPILYGDYNAANRIIFETHRGKTWQEALDFAAEGRQALLAAVERLGPDGLERADLLPWIDDQPIWRRIHYIGVIHPYQHIGEHYRDNGQIPRYAGLIEEMARVSASLDGSPCFQGGIHYDLARAHALRGENGRALEELGAALSLNPGLVERARQDNDLASLRSEPRFQALAEP